jgi:regulator of protease activity HflC (stomatin/prohibitin superfamily)
MTKFFKGLMLAAAALSMAACSKVPAGNVGVIANLYGSDKGIQNEVVGPGRYWISYNQDLFLFPTFTQTYTWQKDEAIQFQDKDGLPITAAMGITYSINKDKAAVLFAKYRKGIEEITSVYLHNMVRDAIVEAAASHPVDYVYGHGKTALISEVTQNVRNQVGKYGINVEKIYWVGAMQLPETVQATVNAKMAATQKALQRENEVATATAQGQIDVAKATGEAKARMIAAQAEADANRVVAASLTPTLVEKMKIEKWRGNVPQVSGGNTPIIDLR